MNIITFYKHIKHHNNTLEYIVKNQYIKTVPGDTSRISLQQSHIRTILRSCNNIFVFFLKHHNCKCYEFIGISKLIRDVIMSYSIKYQNNDLYNWFTLDDIKNHSKTPYIDIFHNIDPVLQTSYFSNLRYQTPVCNIFHPEKYQLNYSLPK